MRRQWFQAISWSVVVEINRQLCLPQNAFHGPTSEGYEPTRQLWESEHSSEMTLSEAVETCRRCHQLAPFCNFNGNTFVAVIRKVIADISQTSEQAALLRSLAGHIVAGIATPEEENAFAEILNTLRS